MLGWVKIGSLRRKKSTNWKVKGKTFASSNINKIVRNLDLRNRLIDYENWARRVKRNRKANLRDDFSRPDSQVRNS